MKFEQPNVEREMSTEEEDLLFTEEKRFGKISSNFELKKTMGQKARELINAFTLATMLSTMGAGLAKAEKLASESGDGNKDSKNNTELVDEQGSEGRIFTPEMIQKQIDQVQEWADESRAAQIEKDKPVPSEEMYELNKKHDAAITLGREDEAKDIMREMLQLAEKNKNPQDIEIPRWDMMTRTEKSFTTDELKEYTWVDSAPMEGQSPEWQELNKIFIEAIDIEIPEGDLSAEQKDDLVLHLKRLEALSLNQSIDREILDLVYEKIRDIAIKTERVEAEIIARNHMDSYELRFAKDHQGGALPDEKHSPEWREMDATMKGKLKSVDGAHDMWTDCFTAPTPELLELLHENGVE